MANPNSGTPHNQVVNGARAYLTLNGKVVGYVTNVSYQRNVNQSPVNVIGNILVEEFVPVAVDYSGSVGRVEIMTSTTTEAGMTVPIESIYTAPSLNLALVDGPTNRIYRTLEGVKLTGGSADVNKGSQTMVNMSFVAILSRDANGVIDV